MGQLGYFNVPFLDQCTKLGAIGIEAPDHVLCCIAYLSCHLKTVRKVGNPHISGFFGGKHKAL